MCMAIVKARGKEDREIFEGPKFQAAALEFNHWSWEHRSLAGVAYPRKSMKQMRHRSQLLPSH